MRWEGQSEEFRCACHGGTFDRNGNVIAGPPPHGLDQYQHKLRGRSALRARYENKTIANLARSHAARTSVGWEKGLGPFLFKKLPSKTGWALTLGSASVLLFVTMFVTGVFLAMYYNPSPDKAYQAIDYIMNDVPAGRILRGIHHWGASAMVIIVFLHMVTNFFSGTYKRRAS